MAAWNMVGDIYYFQRQGGYTMNAKIGCLHSHYSNIEYLQKAFASGDLELIHFVDPGLMNRITSDQSFSIMQAKNKVIEQVEWISQSGNRRRNHEQT